jgi:hypothetical protein
MHERRMKRRPSTIARVLLRRRFAALACSAAMALWLTACGVSVSPIESSATIWFHPLPPPSLTGSTSGSGSTDYLALFQPDAPWPRAMAQTHVFGLYAGFIAAESDQVLDPIVAFLNAHNMGIEIEAPALQATAACGSGVEGYVPYGQSVQSFTLAYLQRLKALGAQVPFIKVDEPYFYGTVVGDPRSCHFSVTQVATEVGEYAQLVHTVYPDTAVGDVEPVVENAYAAGIVPALEQWHDTYQAVTGAPFPFYFADIDFTNPPWPTIVKQLEDGARQRGMKFGIIYIGDYPDTSDAEWAAQVVARFHLYQGQYGGRPDYVLFQSWEPHPLLCLPETDPIAFTGVIDAYIDATG